MASENSLEAGWSLASEPAKRPQIGPKMKNLGLAIVISGMFFNGVIYGYTSPALPSFYLEPKEQSTDTILPK